MSQCALSVLIDGTFVLYQFLPPLCVLVVDVHQRFVCRLPFVWCGEGSRGLSGPRLSDKERCVDTFVARAFASDVCHPVFSLVWAHPVCAVPLPVDERGEASALVHVPSGLLVVEDATERGPVQKVAAFCKPRGVAATVCPATAVIYDVCHIPSVSFAIDGGAVDFVSLVSRCDHHTVFVRCLHLVVYALHDIMTDTLCSCDREYI